MQTLSNSWESVRKGAYEILSLFPPNCDYLTPEYIKRVVFTAGIDLSNNPIIRICEAGAMLITLLANRLAHAIPTIITVKEPTPKPEYERLWNQLNLIDFLVDVMQQRFNESKSFFLVDSQAFNKSLFHGLITSLSHLIGLHSDVAEAETVVTALKTCPPVLKKYQDIFEKFIPLIGSVMKFATQVSAENVSTFVLDNLATRDALKKKKERILKGVDCRGHFIFETITNDDDLANSNDQAIKTINALSQGNTLLESLDGPQDEMDSENICVVAFYLITRESGLLFQNLANLIYLSEKEHLNLFKYEDIELLVNCFFESLLWIKHIGSIDRISSGLSLLSQNFFAVNNPKLYNLTQDLLEKILSNLQNNVFKNFLRRSAGIPPAILCLLKTEPLGRRSKLLPTTFTTIFAILDKEDQLRELKIHALNILKLIFQDAQMKYDIEPFIGKCFKYAINGFMSNDWSLRNSSLMLFAAIWKRIIGNNKVVDQRNMRNNKNINEFFSRAPELKSFFLSEINNFLTKESYQTSMYPSLYPIALILSKLLPYDFNVHFAGEDNEDDVEETKKDDGIKKEINPTEEPTVGFAGQLTAKEIDTFQKTLIQCSHNKNYMGRIMCAQGILPFISMDNIGDFILKILQHENLVTLKAAKSNHNLVHGLLLHTYYILSNFFNIREEMNIRSEPYDKAEEQIAAALHERIFLLEEIKCPPVENAYVHVLDTIAEYSWKPFKATLDVMIKRTEKELDASLELPFLRYAPDFGHSLLRRNLLNFALNYLMTSHEKEAQEFILKYHIRFIKYYTSNPKNFEESDNEIFQMFLSKIYDFLKKHIKKLDKSFLTAVLDPLLDMLVNQTACHVPEFNTAVLFAMKIFKIVIKHSDFPAHHTNQALWNLHRDYITKFPENYQLCQCLLINLGYLLRRILSTKATDVDHTSIFSEYYKFLIGYSSSDIKEVLRYSCLKSVVACLPQILDVAKNAPSKHVPVFKFLLRICQDEIPELREVLARALSPVLFTAHGQQANIVKETAIKKYDLNANYCLRTLIDLYFQWVNAQSGEDIAPVITFVCEMMFTSDFIGIKDRNHAEKRIFAFDKPNKYYDEFLLKSSFVLKLQGIWDHFKSSPAVANSIAEAVDAYLTKFPPKFPVISKP